MAETPAGRPGSPLPFEAWRARWGALGERLLGRRDDPRWGAEGAALLDAWDEPHRAYHSLAHLRACLAELDTVRALATEPDLVELALWFHDAVYNPLAPDNEARSAAWGRTFCDDVGIGAHGGRVEALVLATQHHAVPADDDTALLVDVDLAILGRPPAIYDRYERDVRQEYAVVPDALFAAGRARVLRELLARPRLYNTPEMARRYEAAARANLVGALEALRR